MLFLPVSGASFTGRRERPFRRCAAARARKDLSGEAQCLDVNGSVQRVVTKLQASVAARRNSFDHQIHRPLFVDGRKAIGIVDPSFLYRSVQRQISDVKKISIPIDKKFR
ncbi:hypothetical protein LZ518_07035 [Sphingomonas sp. RB56-2]|uniref:CBS domain-containing protein n=1 Tax=Sphingomonas brevis TaxID=2908206 RepID=A0ABT0S916_9SPHN|nr:hypothetical protein [Sphingomonas brevis]MCL6740883.1 hypothetical protein [Sphingomonas brevis]